MKYFSKLKIYKMPNTALILGNSFFLKKLRKKKKKNSRLLNKAD